MRLELIRRLLLVLTIALWFGGFTFYAEAVIPLGHSVLHSELKVGYLTQKVTIWLNVVSLAPLAMMIWNWAATRNTVDRSLSRRLLISFAVIVVCLIALFLIHPFMDAQLNRETNEILNEKYFHLLHGTYETFATIQWLATILHLWWCLRLWQKADATVKAA